MRPAPPRESLFFGAATKIEGAMNEFRKHMDREVWHWRRNCPEWPNFNYFNICAAKIVRKLCKECERIQSEADCGN